MQISIKDSLKRMFKFDVQTSGKNFSFTDKILHDLMIYEKGNVIYVALSQEYTLLYVNYHMHGC